MGLSLDHVMNFECSNSNKRMMKAWSKQKLQFITLEITNSSLTYIYTLLFLLVVSKVSEYVYRVIFMDSNNAPILEASDSALEAYYLVS